MNIANCMISPLGRAKLVLFGSLALWALNLSIQTVSATSEPSTVATPLMPLRKALNSAIEEDHQIVSRCNADLEYCPSLPFPRGPAQFFTINEIVGSGTSNTRSMRLTIELDEPFRLTVSVQPEGLLWAHWRKVEADTDQEMLTLRKCIADRSQCSEAAAQFGAIVLSARQRTGRARLELVHRLVNLAIRYKTDEEQWGVPDLWSSPLSTFATGFGDCEDYVIAKYVALHESGVADKDLRMVLGYDKGRRSVHAVLAVRDDGDWLVLDHLAPRPLPATDLTGFVPLFSLNAHGVWGYRTNPTGADNPFPE